MSFLLWFCLLLLFLIPRFSAVFDFGQELADMLNVFVGPDVYCNATRCERFRGRDLASNYVVAQRRWEQAQLLGCLAR